MTNLSGMLFAGLLLQRRNRDTAARDNSFAPIGLDNDDLRAARERARKRS